MGLKFLFNDVCAGDEEIPSGVQRVHEHRAAPGVDPLQPPHPGGTRIPAEPAEGHQGSGGDELRAGGGVQLHADRQGPGSVGRQVLPLPQTYGVLHC